MGVHYRSTAEKEHYDGSFPDPGDITDPARRQGDNNNMAMTVMALEHVYKDPALGDYGLSLRDGGKSRADLWSLAAILAVEYSVNENNLACGRADLPWTNKKGSGAQGCGRRDMDQGDCYVEMPRIPFRTGRVDCIPAEEEPYIASKTEVHPSLYFDGEQTLEFFATHFGINDPREVVALMGAHTLGKVDQRNTLVKYWWTRGEHTYFNNQYYKSMVDDRDWAIQCPRDKASFWLIGEPDGSAGKVTWKAHGRGWMENGGPFTWRRDLDLCFDGKSRPSWPFAFLPYFAFCLR